MYVELLEVRKRMFSVAVVVEVCCAAQKVRKIFFFSPKSLDQSEGEDLGSALIF